MTKQTILHALEQLLTEHANAERARQQEKYMRNAMTHYGVQKPVVAQIAKAVAKQHPPKTNQEYCDTIVYLFEQAKNREIWYAAMDYATIHKKFITVDALDTYIKLVRLSQWWDTVDHIAVNLVGKALHKSPLLEQYSLTWIKDENMWVRRTALLAQLKYKETLNTDLLEQCIIPTMHEKQFFIRKAIGWILRQYSYTNPQWVIDFVDKHATKLSGLSSREALRVIKKNAL